MANVIAHAAEPCNPNISVAPITADNVGHGRSPSGAAYLYVIPSVRFQEMRISAAECDEHRAQGREDRECRNQRAPWKGDWRAPSATGIESRTPVHLRDCPAPKRRSYREKGRRQHVRGNASRWAPATEERCQQHRHDPVPGDSNRSPFIGNRGRRCQDRVGRGHTSSMKHEHCLVRRSLEAFESGSLPWSDRQLSPEYLAQVRKSRHTTRLDFFRFPRSCR